MSFTDNTVLFYPPTPPRYDSKSKKSGQNMLAETISVSSEKKLSQGLSSEAEKEYVMYTSDQGSLIEAMDTLDDTKLNKDLSSTAIEKQKSEDEADVETESEEEIPSSIATPSVANIVFNIKKNVELSESKKHNQQKNVKVNTNDQENEKSIESIIDFNNEYLIGEGEGEGNSTDNEEDWNNVLNYLSLRKKDNEECKLDSNTDTSCNKAEEFESKTNDLYMTDISDTEEVRDSCSPHQSTRIDNLASVSLPSFAQISCVADQLEESFQSNKSILKQVDSRTRKSISIKKDKPEANVHDNEVGNESNIFGKNKNLCLTTPAKSTPKAVAKVVDSPKTIVDLTSEGNSNQFLLEKGNREEINDIIYITTCESSPKLIDLTNGNQQFSKKLKQINESTVHNDHLLITTTVIAEVTHYFGETKLSFSGKLIKLSFSKDISIFHQMIGSDKNKFNKRNKKGLLDDDLMIHDPAFDSIQPKTKSPKIEEDKCKKIEKTICEGNKSSKEEDKTHKTGKTTRDKVPKIRKIGLSNDDLMIHDASFETLQPNTNLDLNIQDTSPPSSQSPNVEVGSLYNAFNINSKSSRKQNAYSSKVCSPKDSSFNSTPELSVYTKYKESTTHFSDEEMCGIFNSGGVSPLKQEHNKKRNSNIKRKVSFEESLIREKSPKVAVKKSRGRPKKSLNVAERFRKNYDVKDDLVVSQDLKKRKPRVKNSRSKKAALADFKHNITTSKNSIYSDFCSEDEFDWQKGKEEEQKVKKSAYADYKDNPTTVRHSIYSDFSSEDEYGWLKGKEVKPKSKAIKSYGKVNWSYRSIFLDKDYTPPKRHQSTPSTINKDSKEDGLSMFQSVKHNKYSIGNPSQRRITRGFLIGDRANKEEKQKISWKKPPKSKRSKNSTKIASDLIQTVKTPEVQNKSWCNSVSRAESPDILRQNSCSSVDSQTPSIDFNLVPSGRGLESIKHDGQIFGISPPETVQKRIRKSVDDTNIKSLLKDILPNPRNMCRNMNVGKNTSDSGIYPLAPNNTPVSPDIAEKEESKRKDNYYYITDTSDKEETQGSCSPQQSTMISDLASKSLPSPGQFSYVSEQLEDSFLVDKSGMKTGYGTEETSTKNLYESPQKKCSVSPKPHLYSDEDSPIHISLLQQPRKRLMIESALENEYSGNLNQNHEENEVNTVFVASNDDKSNVSTSPEHDNTGTVDFSVQMSTKLDIMKNKDAELGSLQISDAFVASNDDKSNVSTSPEHDNTGTVDESVQISAKLDIMKNKDAELGSLQISDSSIKNINSTSSELFSLEIPIQSKNSSNQDKESRENHTMKSKQPKLCYLQNNESSDTHEKKEGIDGASQQTSTSNKNPLKNPEVSQHPPFLNTDDIGISDFYSSSQLTPNRHRMIIQQMEEIKTHVAVSYHKTVSLWENIMKVLGEKDN